MPASTGGLTACCHSVIAEAGIAMTARSVKPRTRSSASEAPKAREERSRRSTAARPLSEPKPPFASQRQQPPGLESELDPAPRYQAAAYKAAGKLEGLRALITGGDSGIGRAVAVLYAREGADVAIVYLPEEQSDAEVTRDEIVALGRHCELMPGDLTEPGFCEMVVERTVETLGGIDVLVSNAAQQSSKKLEELEDADLLRTFETNIFAYMRLARAALKHMKRGAAIVATSSVTGIQGTDEMPDYSATKGAVNAFTKSLAIDLVERGIRVNAVAPGPVWTPLNPSDTGRTPDEVAKFGADSPMKRPAQPEELAPAYVFLASNADSSYITGTVLQVMGGETTGG